MKEKYNYENFVLVEL